MTKKFKVKDPYFLEAKKKGYRARSAFKLLEIQNKFKLIKEGQTIVDLGSAPGSFLQVISEIVGPKGRAIGIDLQEMEPLDMANVILIQGDIFQTNALVDFFQKNGFGNVDVVTSDLAPKTSGIKDLDQGRSVELTEQAFLISTKILKEGGHFVGKVFQGEDLDILMGKMKPFFKSIVCFKPKACRQCSFETYIVAKSFKPGKIRA
ncbi:RlmE family RNA methyltransferase [Patescibacteria group bacterium]|nr:RlmE family RNA methyltransferase [Patescibacteria group bacterium]